VNGTVVHLQTYIRVGRDNAMARWWGIVAFDVDAAMSHRCDSANNRRRQSQEVATGQAVYVQRDVLSISNST